MVKRNAFAKGCNPTLAVQTLKANMQTCKMHAHTCVHTHAYTHAYYTHTHTHIHTHTHTHTHTRAQAHTNTRTHFKRILSSEKLSPTIQLRPGPCLYGTCARKMSTKSVK